jgi:hypothetical protein
LVDVHCWNVSGVCLGRESTDALSSRSAAEGSRVVEEATQSCLQQNSYSFLLAPTFPFVFRRFSMLESIQVQVLEEVWL